MENVVPSENEVVGTLLALHRQVYCLQALVLGLLSDASEGQKHAAGITLDTAVKQYKQPVKFGLEQTPAELLASVEHFADAYRGWIAPTGAAGRPAP